MIAKTITYKNKKASYKFEFIERYVAGLVLTGTEIKSVREGKVNFTDAYCVFREGELWATGIHIAEYYFGTINNHEPKRDRKLLLKARELNKLQKKVSEKGLTIIPVEMIINEKGLAKLDIALAKGKKIHDKREDIKLRDNKREMERTNR